MSTHIKRLLGHRLFLAMSLVFALLVFSLVLAQPPKAGACPSRQIEYTYYTDSTYTESCGDKIITCYCGVYRSGCNTPYYTIDYYDC